MAVLELNRIKLHGSAATKEEAIRQAGELLVSSGCVKPRYIEGMLAREGTMSTYLGEGVAIPHGEYDYREDIIKTGISVFQIQNGVIWEDDEKAYVIIGIAASADEHVGVLANLAEAIEDEELVQMLRSTNDPAIVMQILGAENEG